MHCCSVTSFTFMQYLASDSYVVFTRNPVNHMLLESSEFQEFESLAIVSLPHNTYFYEQTINLPLLPKRAVIGQFKKLRCDWFLIYSWNWK